MDVSLRMWASGSKKSKGFKVSPLEEPVAIDIGADLLGEVFIFSVGAGNCINRSSNRSNGLLDLTSRKNYFNIPVEYDVVGEIN